jgi:hypothetical protein
MMKTVIQVPYYFLSIVLMLRHDSISVAWCSWVVVGKLMCDSECWRKGLYLTYLCRLRCWAMVGCSMSAAETIYGGLHRSPTLCCAQSSCFGRLPSSSLLWTLSGKVLPGREMIGANVSFNLEVVTSRKITSLSVIHFCNLKPLQSKQASGAQPVRC